MCNEAEAIFATKNSNDQNGVVEDVVQPDFHP